MFDLALVLLLGQVPASSCGVADEAEFATTKEHAVQVGGGAVTVAARERRYLDALRGPEGQPVQYKRLNSERGPDQQTILDRYEVSYPGLEKPLYLFLDAYHYDDALKAPKGFTCAVPIGLAPPPPDPFLAMDATYRLAVDRGNRDIQPARFDIENDRIAVAHRSDRTAVGCFGRHVARHQAMGRTGEAAVRKQRDGIPQTGSDQCCSYSEHFAHAGSALRPLIANHNHVVVFDLTGLHGFEGVFFAIEDPRGTLMNRALVSRHFDYAAFRRQIAFENHQPAGLF